MNFCHPVMNPVIDCSTVCTDGYEVTNLISKDPNLQREGFIAYHGIRPPVTVELSFVCKVNISQIVLWSEVGSQRSTGFELYAASSCNSSTPCVCNNICSSGYKKVAFAFLNGCEKGVIFSRNNNAVASRGDTSSLVKVMFFGGKRALLDNANSLLIKIIKTSSSVPCLAKVEVWGQPSRSCNKATIKQVTTLWKQRFAEVIKTEITTNIHRNDNTNSLHDIEDCSFKIPEEFLDQITFKLMALPMTLPSGKTVDQSTLSKLEQCEAVWGRPPSDPFTGKVFTKGCHPILATSLKARIDKFLIDHSNEPEVKTAPRTVGAKIPSAAVSSPYFHQHTSTILNVYTERNIKETKRSCEVSSEEHGANKKQCVGQSLSLNHEERMNRSLRSAVKNVLAGLPSFTKFEVRQIIPEDCAECHSKVILYKLPCTHFVCRSCLIQKRTSTNMKCSACNAQFQSSDPVWHHF